MQLGYFFGKGVLRRDRDSFRLLIAALPLIAQLLVNAIPFVYDLFLLGHFSTTALASMQISATIFFSLFSVLTVFSTGSLLRTILIGSFAAGLSFMGIDALLSLFPMATPSVKEAAKEYLTCVIPALPIYLVAATLAQRCSISIGCKSMCLHIACSTLLIFGFFGLPSMGVRGAAIASIAGAILQVVLLRKNGLACKGKELSVSSFIERALYYGSFLLLTVMVGNLGDVAMATQQALIALGILCFVCTNALCQTCSQGMAMCLMSALAAILWFGATGCMRLCSSDPEVIALGVSCFSLFAIIQPLSACAVLLSDTRNAKVAFLSGCFVRGAMA
ncbi:MAG: hypothetical protein JSR46_07150, partial [Verrucomicrobia bacterium]|nr:hypothetical protein [Verrucomicrobiota bacterium]